MPKIFVFFILVFAMPLMAQEKPMTVSQKEVFIVAVKESSADVNTITSDFKQIKHLDFLTDDNEIRGTVNFKAPNLMRWEYNKPYFYSIIFTGDKLLINNEGSKSTVDIGSNKLFKMLNDLIITSLNGNILDDAKFVINYKSSADYNLAELIPKDKKLKNFISEFVMYFDKESNQVSQVKMIEPTGDYTLIKFENRIINSEISDEVFTQ